jgi:cold-inducible RNA-binding protein
MNLKLYVGNLSFNTEEDSLQTLFAQAGPVESARIIRDKATGRSRGFAFVEMATEDGARAAIEKFNEADLDGRRLTVNEARPQTVGAGFGRRDGDRGGRGFDGGNRRREPRW